MNPEERMKEEIAREVSRHTAKKVGKVVGIVGMTIAGIFFIILFGFLLGWVIESLWNYAVVDVFDVTPITYWQAVAIFVLAKIFFGFGHSGGAHGKHKHKKDEREAERVRAWWRHRMGGWGEDDATFKQYWEEQGKAAYENYLSTKKLEQQTPPR